MGSGDKIIAIDSHIDTVGIGNRDNWTHDPYEGYEDTTSFSSQLSLGWEIIARKKRVISA